MMLSWSLQRATRRFLRTMSSTPVSNAIESNLRQTFQPLHLDVINESHRHNVPAGSETHFKVVVVSEQFTDQSLVARHRLVNNCLKSELEGPVHALSIVAKTPAQWKEMLNKGQTVGPSPNCRGGDGSLPKK